MLCLPSQSIQLHFPHSSSNIKRLEQWNQSFTFDLIVLVSSWWVLYCRLGVKNQKTYYPCTNGNNCWLSYLPAGTTTHALYSQKRSRVKFKTYLKDKYNLKLTYLMRIHLQSLQRMETMRIGNTAIAMLSTEFSRFLFCFLLIEVHLCSDSSHTRALPLMSFVPS